MSQAATTCWECEERTEVSIDVTLRTSARPIGTFTLCPACYHTRYVPLASEGSRRLLVETRDHGRRRR
jgi:hypothetical protein